MRAQLVPSEGGTPLELNKDVTVVGRKEDCDLRLEHKSISKLHCVLVKTDGLLLLRDLGSTNGTRVNGQRVRRAALLPNDELTIAGLAFRVAIAAGEPPASPYECTQQLGPEEVALLGQSGAKEDKEPADSDGSPGNHLLKINALPDVYPQEDKPA